MKFSAKEISLCCFLLISCAIEDPSVASFDLQRIRLSEMLPFNYNFEEPKNTHAEKQANLFYSMSNGDTMKISIYEYSDITLAKAFFYNSDSITEKTEFLINGERKRFLLHGRRVFVFSYMFSISENSSMLDSLVSFAKRFPANTKASENLCKFSLKNTDADNDISVQSGYFLGVEAPFNMLVRRYSDSSFSWVCACSSGKVSNADWAVYSAKRQENFYEGDSTVIINRLQNGVVVAVYGDLDKERMLSVYKKFVELVR